MVDRIADLLPHACVRITRGLEEVAPALAALHETGADTLFVVGGDGTITGTLTELLRSWPRDELPALAITPGGTINTISRSLGARGGPEQMLAHFLSRPRAEPVPRAILRVDADRDPPRYGMIFANGAAARWLESYYGGRSGKLSAASLVARTLASIPVGGKLARDMFHPYAARLEIDGKAEDGQYTVAGAATIRHVGLGFAPFLTAGQHPDRFHWLATAASPTRLGREIPGFAVGVYRHDSCLAHASAAEVKLTLEEPEPYTIDGDLFPACSELRISVGATVGFLTP